MRSVIEDFEACYRWMQSRDTRYDGRFIVAVTSTHIYCRPSCPARTPLRRNVRFFPSTAAAQRAGFRACKRCRPDTAPASPSTTRQRPDTAARALSLIADGVLDREGVGGLAGRLHFSERHLHRLLREELGAGPLALGRAQRAQTARMLIESSALPFAEVSRAAGFHSVRQFNETIRSIYAASPRELRGRATANGARARGGAGSIELDLRGREPLDAAGLLEFLGRRALPGLEAWDGTTYQRALSLAHGSAVAEFSARPSSSPGIRCTLHLRDVRDLTSAVERARRLLDLDCDPRAISMLLGADEILGPLIATHPGLRVPGCVDGGELAVRALLGQQVSIDAARKLASDLLQAHGEPLSEAHGTITHSFPRPAALAALDPAGLPMPRARASALVALCAALARDEIRVDPGEDPARVHEQLLAVRGIGPWTAGYIAMRALRDPDVFLPTDAGVRRALAGQSAQPETWRPWRSYAVIHLWKGLEDRD